VAKATFFLRRPCAGATWAPFAGRSGQLASRNGHVTRLGQNRHFVSIPENICP